MSEGDLRVMLGVAVICPGDMVHAAPPILLETTPMPKLGKERSNNDEGRKPSSKGNSFAC